MIVVYSSEVFNALINFLTKTMIELYKKSKHQKFFKNKEEINHLVIKH